MLSGISSYLFGSASGEEHPAATTASAINLALDSETDLQLKATPAQDGEWMLVDRLSRSPSPCTGTSEVLDSHPLEPRVEPELSESVSRSTRKSNLHLSLRQPHQTRTMSQRNMGILTNSVRSMSKKERSSKSHSMSKNNLRRCNQTTHYNTRCKRQRRGNHIMQPSCRSSNKKC